MTTVLRRHPIVSTVVALPLVVALAFTGLFALWLSGAQLPFASGAMWFKITKTASADYTPSPTAPVFILAIGNDGRTGQTSTRGDAIHLIGVNPTTHQATILDFPRDTGMQIPGHGLDKVNASHVDGGPRLEAQTIANTVHVQIPYVIDTNFDGFIGMVDDMGGLDVNVPERMKDSFSGADLPAGAAAPQRPPGAELRAKPPPVPDRRPQALREPGVPDHLQRSRHSGRKQTGPIGTLNLLANLGRHTQLDGVGINDLYDLGRLGLSVDPANIRNVVAPVASGSGTRLQLTSAASSLFADFADDAVLQTH